MKVTQLFPQSSPPVKLTYGPVPPAAGFTVAVTAQRRADELAMLLERRGAKVILAPAIRIVPVVDDAELSLATKELLAIPPDLLVATTGIGFRGWMEAAGEWGVVDPLIEMLGTTRILARGPKARGAVRAAGLQEEWSPESESSAEVLDRLLQEDLHGVRIAVQLHGNSLPEFVEPLRRQGAIVIELSPYRWLPPLDITPLRRLLEMIISYQIDAVTFTSAPAVLMMLELADTEGIRPALVQALENNVMAICVGPVTGEALSRIKVPTIQPPRSRLGALAREVVEQLQARSQVIECMSGSLDIRGQAVVFAGELRPLAPAPMAILRALAVEPGSICSRRKLAQVLPGGSDNDDHAVDVAVGRLRTALGDRRLIQTVVRRGYRLNVCSEFTGVLASLGSDR